MGVPETFVLNNTQIFSCGQWNGDIYTEADLDSMIASFNQVGFNPPLKLGHDPSQPLAQSDGMPAIGWVTNLRRVGKTLLADLTNLPKKVYEAIKRKNYDRVSAEIYWNYEANGRQWPRVLKALSLLGADIPAVTDLAALETLYDAKGLPFKRYDFGPEDLGMMPMPSYPSSDSPKKDKPTVHYRTGGGDSDQDGLPDFCGNCEFYCGPSDPTGQGMYLGCCSLVDGEVATGQVCDLYEVDDAFQSFSTHATQYASEQFTDAPWDGSASRFTIDQMMQAVPDAMRTWAKQQAKHGARDVTKDDLKLPYREPDGTVNLNGVRAALAAIGGARGGVKDVPQATLDKAKTQLEHLLAMGNKKMMSTTSADARARDASMAKGTDVDEHEQTIEELTAQLAVSVAEKSELEKKYSDASTKVTELSQKLPEAERKLATLEAEKADLTERNRVSAKQAWFTSITTMENLKLIPVERPLAEHLYDVLDGVQVKAYAATDGKDLTHLEAFKSLFESRKPGTLLFTELSVGTATETAGEPETTQALLHPSQAKAEAVKRAKAYILEHTGTSFKSALTYVYTVDPALKAMSAGVTPEGEAKAESGTAHFERMFKP